jgi:hypothetical protein
MTPAIIRAGQMTWLNTFFENFSAAQEPFLLLQVNNQLVHNFLSQRDTRISLYF